MVNSMTARRSITLALCALFMTSSVQMHASAIPTIGQAKRAAIVAFIVGTVFKFFSTEPNTQPYSFDVDLLTSNPYAWLKTLNRSNFSEQMYNVWADGIAGHAGKGSSIKVSPDGKTLDVRPAYEPKGIGGYVHYYSKPLATAVGFVAICNAFKDQISGGIKGLIEYIKTGVFPKPEVKLKTEDKILGQLEGINEALQIIASK